MESFLTGLGFLTSLNVKCDLHLPGAPHFPTFAYFSASLWDLTEHKLKRNEQIAAQIPLNTNHLKKDLRMCVIISSWRGEGVHMWIKFKWPEHFFKNVGPWNAPTTQSQICHLSPPPRRLRILSWFDECSRTFVPFLPSINPEYSRQISFPGRLLTFWQSSGTETLFTYRVVDKVELLNHHKQSHTKTVCLNLDKCGNLWDY